MLTDRTMMGRMLLTEGDLVSKLAGCPVHRSSSSSNVRMSSWRAAAAAGSSCFNVSTQSAALTILGRARQSVDKLIQSRAQGPRVTWTFKK